MLWVRTSLSECANAQYSYMDILLDAPNEVMLISLCKWQAEQKPN